MVSRRAALLTALVGVPTLLTTAPANVSAAEMFLRLIINCAKQRIT